MVDPATDSRQERRKTVTRNRILNAANELFEASDYAATSLEDIAKAADVAVRTIYLHFPSKAAIILAYFDEWVDAFVREIARRPVTEPLVETVTAALAAMSSEGWTDRVEDPSRRAHPLVHQLIGGPPEIAGHVLQRWISAQTEIATDISTRGDYPVGAVEPRARAVGIFAAWIATMVAAGDQQRGNLPEASTGNSLGIAILASLTGGGI